MIHLTNFEFNFWFLITLLLLAFILGLLARGRGSASRSFR